MHKICKKNKILKHRDDLFWCLNNDRRRLKEWRFNGANWSKHKCACMVISAQVVIQFRPFLKKKSLAYHAVVSLPCPDQIRLNQLFGFPWRSTREDLSIYVSITNVGLILGKLWWFLFSGYGQTGRNPQDFGILLWKHVGTQKISTQSSKLGVSCRSLYASPEDGDA